jgi:hypothetical protein
MRIRIWLLLGLLVGGITGLYMSRVLEPWNDYIGAQPGGLKAQMWDLYPRWVGARELLLHGRNPYGPEVSGEIQMAFYGHIIVQDYRDTGHKVIDEQRFAYPVYVVFLMAPFMYVDFGEVLRWAPFVLGLLAAFCVPLSLGLLRWRLPWTAVAAITLFVVSSPQIVQGMRHQQLAVVVGLAIIAGAWCIRKNHLLCAGAVLAWSTIKPQMAFFPLCFFLVWVIGDWSKRWRLFAGFLVTLAILFGAGELILPGWIGYFIDGALAYRKYFPLCSLLSFALGHALGQILGTGIVLAVLILAWRNRGFAADSREFVTTFSFFLMATMLAFPLFTPFNQVLLILPVMLLLHDWSRLPKFSRLLFVACIGWPWIASSLLLLFPPPLNPPNELPLLPLLTGSFFPIILPFLLATRRNNPTPQPAISSTSI